MPKRLDLKEFNAIQGENERLNIELNRLRNSYDKVFAEKQELANELKFCRKEITVKEDKINGLEKEVRELENTDLDDVLNSWGISNVIETLEFARPDVKIIQVPTHTSLMEVEEFLEVYNPKYLIK